MNITDEVFEYFDARESNENFRRSTLFERRIHGLERRRGRFEERGTDRSRAGPRRCSTANFAEATKTKQRRVEVEGTTTSSVERCVAGMVDLTRTSRQGRNRNDETGFRSFVDI